MLQCAYYRSKFLNKVRVFIDSFRIFALFLNNYYEQLTELSFNIAFKRSKYNNNAQNMQHTKLFFFTNDACCRTSVVFCFSLKVLALKLVANTFSCCTSVKRTIAQQFYMKFVTFIALCYRYSSIC